MARPPTLERRILQFLWRGGDRSVREVLEAVGQPRTYSTISTVLRRLLAKGHVERVRAGRSWRYRATRSREAGIVMQIVDLLHEPLADLERVLELLVQELRRSDPASLTRLASVFGDLEPHPRPTRIVGPDGSMTPSSS